MAEVLEIASTANDYAQQAQAIYDTVKGDVAEIKALKDEIDDLVLTFQTIEQLAAQAQANAHSTNDDKLTCQQALQQIQAIAAQTGFSTRTSPTVSESETFPLSNLTPSAYVKVGDLVLNSTNGDLFRITAVTATTATVGAKISNLRGPAVSAVCKAVRDPPEVRARGLWVKALMPRASDNLRSTRKAFSNSNMSAWRRLSFLLTTTE